ncbi:hypothetical protein [Homoserinimonas sedimenticola]|uniref:hypothetical protein n=1 Tax=Homoserinimonas sedimenticola TaxID=2986805 RepID=UPI0022368F02|nr:hypothetical protein [Salinibacterium sedimenticola]
MLIASTTACTRASYADSAYSAPSCSQLLASAIAYERSGTGDIDSTLQALTDHCSNEYEIAVDYLSNSTDGAFRIDSCEELLNYRVRSEAVRLLEQDGQCSFGGTDIAVGPEWPDGGLGWNSAREHSGTVQRVCGPLMSARETGDGTFLNIGQDYPSAGRFTIIFWDIYLQPIEHGVTLCGTGEIYLYEGVAQMEMWDPAALEIWQ